MSRLERWSRLKRNLPQEQDASTASLPAAKPVDELTVDPDVSPVEAEQDRHAPDAIRETTEHAPPGPSISEPTPKPGSLDHTLPDPETLEAGSDFSAFMVPGVSGALRRRALKRLWATGNYNVRDGLDDYDADYNKLLKPMASELAGKLRRWTHKIEEAADKSLEDAEPESPQESEADRQSTEPSNERTDEPLAESNAESATSCDNSGHIVEKPR